MSNTPAGEPGSATAADAGLVRVERGTASPEELAAVTALLLARAGANRRHEQVPAARPRSTRAGWRRLERRHGFRAPRSWQG